MKSESHSSPSAVLKGIRAVSFDLDDTFWDCEPVIIHAEETLYQWLMQHHPQIVKSHTRATLRDLRANLYRTHPHLSTDVTEMRKAGLRQLFDTHNDSEQLVKQAFAVFFKARSEVVLYEGTHELLAALQKTHKIAAITNGNASLELIGLADLHVGDNPQTDVIGGHNAGVRTVWYNQNEATWPDHLQKPDFEVTSLPELQVLLTPTP